MAGPLLSPLPIRTRAFHGENARSYTARLLRANGIDHITLLGWLRALYDISGEIGSAEWLPILRRLGGLGAQTLEAPLYTSRGDWVTDRRLCIECCDGHVCSGRLPDVGKICLKHHRWLDTGCRATDAGAIAAERTFRRKLRPTEVTYDGLLMARSLTIALVAGTPKESASQGVEHRFFASQVAVAVWLRSMLPLAIGPIPPSRILEAKLEAILRPTQVDMEPWRAVMLIRRTVAELTDREEPLGRNADPRAWDKRIPLR